jgi:hypothetical protein
LGVGTGHPTLRTRPLIGWLTTLILLGLIRIGLMVAAGNIRVGGEPAAPPTRLMAVRPFEPTIRESMAPMNGEVASVVLAASIRR